MSSESDESVSNEADAMTPDKPDNIVPKKVDLRLYNYVYPIIYNAALRDEREAYILSDDGTEIELLEFLGLEKFNSIFERIKIDLASILSDFYFLEGKIRNIRMDISTFAFVIKFGG